MNKLYIAPILALALFSCSGKAADPPGADLVGGRKPVEISANVDRAVATTGDVIRYSITMLREPDTEAVIPEVGPLIQGFRIVDMGYEPGKRVEGRIKSERWYTLRADLVGSYILPEVEVRSVSGEEEQVVRAGPIYIEVESVLPEEGAAADIRDIKPIAPYPRRPLWQWLILAFGISGLLGGIGWIIWKIRKGRKMIVPERPPWELAREELERLFQLGLLEAGETRSFFFHISEIFRRYLEKRFNFFALENTREEIVHSLARIDEIEQGLRESAGDFLNGSDLVKYAKYLPPEGEVEMRIGQVKDFIDSTVTPLPAADGKVAKETDEAQL